MRVLLLPEFLQNSDGPAALVDVPVEIAQREIQRGLLDLRQPRERGFASVVVGLEVDAPRVQYVSESDVPPVKYVEEILHLEDVAARADVVWVTVVFSVVACERLDGHARQGRRGWQLGSAC